MALTLTAWEDMNGQFLARGVTALELEPALGKMLATPSWLPLAKLIIMHVPPGSRASQFGRRKLNLSLTLHSPRSVTVLGENHIPKVTGIVQKGHSNVSPSFVPSKPV